MDFQQAVDKATAYLNSSNYAECQRGQGYAALAQALATKELEEHQPKNRVVIVTVIAGPDVQLDVDELQALRNRLEELMNA